MADIPRPQWKCGEDRCPAHRRWQPVPAARHAGDLDAALAALNGHYAAKHPVQAEAEEVIGHVQLAA